MGRDALTSNSWCNTCGRSLIEVEIDAGLGDCFPCAAWWEEQEDEINRLGREWEEKYGEES